MNVEVLLNLATAEGYQVRLRQWVRGTLLHADVKVLDGHGRAISQRQRHGMHPSGLMDRCARDSADDVRRYARAQAIPGLR
jgi:hypothetical protein